MNWMLRQQARRWAWFAFGCALAVWTAPARADAEPDISFAKICAPCHGPDGRARTPVARKLGVRDLTQSKTTDEEIRKRILDGALDKKGKPTMPSFRDKLSDEQLQTLVTDVKALRK